jgi:DedD protein
MDRGLQERLVGAAVLVALGVWLIPWVLDGNGTDADQPATTQTDAIKLPTPGAGGATVIRRQTIDLSAERTAAVKSPQADQIRSQQSAPADEPRTLVNAAPSAAAEDAAPSPPPRAEPAQTQPEAAVAAAAAPSAEQQRETRAVSLPEIIAASPVTGWMVQLGSFSNSGNARRQAQRVETFGHDARIYEFAAAGGRTMFRVRLGPLESRERAEATASSLAANGFVAQLVAPE